MLKLNLQYFANSITLFKKYIPLLDEVYKLAALTSKLDGNPDLARQGANADELIIPKIDMQGLAAYSRNSGYVSGDVTLANYTVKCNFDRGRMFTVDALDNEETAGLAFGRLAGEFIRTKVVPELDAFRFAMYASETGISTVTGAALADAAAVIAALRAATNKLDEDEVPYENRHLFITPTLMGLVEDQDTTKSKEVLARFASTTRVPQTRFYTAITQYDGTTEGQEAGGYVKGASAKNINFLILHKDALIQYQKRTVPKVITPEQNQNSDGWKFGYRDVGIAEVYENKRAGIYLHKGTS